MSLTDRTVELLQTLIRNECVNDGTRRIGPRNAQRRRARAGDRRARPSTSSGSSRFRDGRRSSAGSPAPTRTPRSLCLMGHTDVVPVHADGWINDPFGGETHRRRGVGSRCCRHAQPDRFDGGGVSPAGRRRGSRCVPAHRRPDLLRSRGRGGGECPRRALDCGPSARRHPGRLRADGERRAAQRPVRRAVRRRERRREGCRLAPPDGPGHTGTRFDAVPQGQCAGQGGRSRRSASPTTGRHRGSASCGAARSSRSACPTNESATARRADDRRAPRRSAAHPRAATPARMHTHDVLTEPGRRRRDEDQRHPRSRRGRRRHPHPAGGGPGRGRRPPARGARRSRRSRRGGGDHGRSGLDQSRPTRRSGTHSTARSTCRSRRRGSHRSWWSGSPTLASTARWARWRTELGCSAPASMPGSSGAVSTVTTSASTSSHWRSRPSCGITCVETYSGSSRARPRSPRRGGASGRRASRRCVARPVSRSGCRHDVGR